MWGNFNPQMGYDPRFFYPPPQIVVPPPTKENGMKSFFETMKEYEQFTKEWEERQKKKEDDKKKPGPTKKPDTKVEFSTALLMTIILGPFVAAGNYMLWQWALNLVK